MAQKLYEESNIQAIANALRSKLGETKDSIKRCTAYIVKTDLATDHDNVDEEANRSMCEAIKLTGAKHARVCVTFKPYMSNTYLHFCPGQFSEYSTFPETSENTLTLNSSVYRAVYSFDIDGYLSYKYKIGTMGGSNPTGYYFEVVGFDDEWNPITYTGAGFYSKDFPVPVLNTFKTVDMATAIASIGTGEGASETTLINKTIDANGTYQAINDGANGYSSVTVDVQPNLGTKSITNNGTYYANTDSVDGYSSVSVNVQPTLQSKMITINDNGTQVIEPDVGFDALSNVTITAIVDGSGGYHGINLDDYGFISEICGSRLTFSNGPADYSTFAARKAKGASGSVAWYVDPSIEVGNNIMDYLKSSACSSSSYYYYGYYYMGTSDTPTMEDMRRTTSSGSQMTVHKYGTVTEVEKPTGGTTIDVGDYVIFDKSGTVIFKDTYANMKTALTDKTIDTFNGIFFINTKVPSKSTSYTYYAGSLKLAM